MNGKEIELVISNGSLGKLAAIWSMRMCVCVKRQDQKAIYKQTERWAVASSKRGIKKECKKLINFRFNFVCCGCWVSFWIIYQYLKYVSSFPFVFQHTVPLQGSHSHLTTDMVHLVMTMAPHCNCVERVASRLNRRAACDDVQFRALLSLRNAKDSASLSHPSPFVIASKSLICNLNFK